MILFVHAVSDTAFSEKAASEEGLVVDSLVGGVYFCCYGLLSVFLGMLTPFLGTLKGNQQPLQLC